MGVCDRIFGLRWRHRDLYSQTVLLWLVFIKCVFFKQFFSNVTTAWVCKIGLLILEQLLLDQLVLVKRLKGDTITVHCVYTKKNLMLLFNEE